MEERGFNLFPDLPSIQESDQTIGPAIQNTWPASYPNHAGVPLSDMNALPLTCWPPIHPYVHGSLHNLGPAAWSVGCAKLQQWSYPSYEFQTAQAVVSPWASTVPMPHSSSSSSYGDQNSLSPVSSYVSPVSWSPVLSRQEIRETYAVSLDSETDYQSFPEYREAIRFMKSTHGSSTSSNVSLGSNEHLGIKLEDVQVHPDTCSEELFNNTMEAEIKKPYPCPLEQPGSHITELQETVTTPDPDNIPALTRDGSSVDNLSACENDSGSDYHPKRARCTHTCNSNSNQKSLKRSKVTKKPKANGKTKTRRTRVTKPSREKAKITGTATSLRAESYKCSQCPQVLSNRSALNKHFTALHTRPFTCTFREYGCFSTFGSKNEWKRHVSSQHLRLGVWRCDMGTCRPSDDGKKNTADQECHGMGATESEVTYNEFNRKDLFTQHLRRMHQPADPKMTENKAVLSTWHDKIAHRCLLDIRSPPPKSTCGYCVAENGGKGVVFHGHGAWEYRMEHVGRHLESGHGEDKKWVEDLGLRDWMREQNLIEWCPGRGYVLPGNAHGLGRR